MKTKFNINRLMKRISILAILLLCAYSVSASPLTVIMGADSNGLDFMYIVLGISAMGILIFYPVNEDTGEELKREELVISSEFKPKHYRKVIRKTA